MNVVKDAASFLLAIKESTTTAYDEDAVTFLEGLVEQVRRGLDNIGLNHPDRQRERDHWLYFEGMLKGVQLKLRRAAYDKSQEKEKPRDPNAYDA